MRAVWLLLSLGSLLGLPVYPDLSQHSSSGKSVSLEDFQYLQVCACDSTLRTCDAFCCCDQDCASALTEHWQS